MAAEAQSRLSCSFLYTRFSKYVCVCLTLTLCVCDRRLARERSASGPDLGAELRAAPSSRRASPPRFIGVTRHGRGGGEEPHTCSALHGGATSLAPPECASLVSDC